MKENYVIKSLLIKIKLLSRFSAKESYIIKGLSIEVIKVVRMVLNCTLWPSFLALMCENFNRNVQNKSEAEINDALKSSKSC